MKYLVHLHLSVGVQYELPQWDRVFENFSKEMTCND